MILTKKPKIVFISEAIRMDCHAPLRLFNDFEVVHLYLRAPYNDMSPEDFKGSKKVDINNLFNLIVSEKPEFIQGPEPFGSRLSYKLAQIALRASQKSGAKLVIPVLENRPINKRFSLLQQIGLRLICPKLFKHASAIICLNKGARTNVEHYCKEANIVTGLMWGVWGVDMDLFSQKGKKEPNRILYVGRLIEDKGLWYLMEGFKTALEKIPNLKLSLIGSGEMGDELNKWVARNGISESVEFLGQKKNKELPEYFSRAQLVIYPSITLERWEEQIGMVNLQSLSCGTPVLTTKSGAIPEYITEGNGAMLVEERSSEEIAKAIERFFSDDEFRRKLELRARPAVAKYDIKKETARAEEMLKELMNDKKI